MHRLLVFGAAALAALMLSGPAAAWSWPADGPVLRPFGMGNDPYAAGQHRGIDVAGPEGSAIHAPAAGIVTFAGSLPTHGRGVTIMTKDGYAVTLVHLGTIGVEKGASVAEGATVGTMGWSGTPEHSVPSVHLGIRRASDAEGYVDPLDLLPPQAAPAPPASPAPAPVPAPAPLPAPTAPPGAAPVAPPTPPAAAPQPAPPAVPSAPGSAAAPVTPPAPAPVAAAAPSGGALDGARPTVEGGASPSAGVVVVASHGTSASTPRPAANGTARPRSLGPAGSALSPVRPAGTSDSGAVERSGGRAIAQVPPSAGRGSAAATDHASVERGYSRSPRESSQSRPAESRPTPRVEVHAVGSSPPGVPRLAGDRVERGSAAPDRLVAMAPTGVPAASALSSAARDYGVPFGPLAAAFLLGCLLAAAGVRGGARGIDRKGVLRRHDVAVPADQRT